MGRPGDSPDGRIMQQRVKLTRKLQWWGPEGEPYILDATEMYRRILWPLLFGRGAFASRGGEARLKQETRLRFVRFKECMTAFYGLVNENPRSKEARAILEALKGPELPPDDNADPRQVDPDDHSLGYRAELMAWASEQVLNLRKYFQAFGDKLAYDALQQKLAFKEATAKAKEPQSPKPAAGKQAAGKHAAGKHAPAAALRARMNNIE